MLLQDYAVDKDLHLAGHGFPPRQAICWSFLWKSEAFRKGAFYSPRMRPGWREIEKTPGFGPGLHAKTQPFG